MTPDAPPADAPPPRPAPRRRNPWWIPPFLGRVPRDLDPAHQRLLGLLALGLAFEQYDMSLLNSAIQHVADDLGLTASGIGFTTAAVRAGGVLTFLLVPLADRLGRRRLFLGALVAMSLASTATAFAQSAVQFAAVQLVARACFLTASVVAVVILVEEFPARHRGWGVGMLVAVSAWGYGLGTALFAAVDALPFGWRALYAAGLVPLLALPRLRRDLRETGRFEAHRDRVRAEAPAAEGWLDPVVRLARSHPGRAAAVGGAGLLGATGSIAVFQYLSPFVQTVHGWAPWQYSAMVIGGGLLGVVGNVVAGRLADRAGRRRVGFAAYALYPLGVLAFYLGPERTLVAAWVLLVFFGTAADVVLRAVASELFPTSHRTTAMGWLILVQTLGWSGGLALVGAGAAAGLDLRVLVAAASGLTLGAACAFLLLPESGRRELEHVGG